MKFHYAVALTGGIGTGKSTVASLFSKEGFVIIDADKVAHEVLDESAKELTAMFGTEIADTRGVDRRALGRMVFQDSQKRKRLEAFMHPLIYQKILHYAGKEEAKKSPYLIDIPLFFETGRYNIPKVIVVYATRQQQIARTMQRDLLDREEVLRRIAAQLDIESKRQKADYLIDNSGDTTQLRQEVVKVQKSIVKDFS
jgi:dephospho-CoA kinase